MIAAYFFLVLGLFFDILSFIFGILGLVQKKHISGFPLPGLGLYSVSALVSIVNSGKIISFSISIGLVILFLVHVFFQMPGFLQVHQLRKQQE